MRLTTQDYANHAGLSAYRLRIMWKNGILPALVIGGDSGRRRLLFDPDVCDPILTQLAEDNRVERAAAAAEV